MLEEIVLTAWCHKLKAQSNIWWHSFLSLKGDTHVHLFKRSVYPQCRLSEGVFFLVIGPDHQLSHSCAPVSAAPLAVSLVTLISCPAGYSIEFIRMRDSSWMSCSCCTLMFSWQLKHCFFFEDHNKIHIPIFWVKGACCEMSSRRS